MAVLAPTLPRVTHADMQIRLDRFRATAAEQGIPPAEVERWMSRLRPFTVLFPGGDGPEAGRWGGNPWLPADVPHPPFTLVATIDCAALPAEATDLPLPSDGHLLLFADENADECCRFEGTVLYLPAGKALAERPYSDDDEDISWPVESMRQTVVSLHLPTAADDGDTPEHPRGKDLAAAWEATLEYALEERAVQLGGLPAVLNHHPIESAIEAAGPVGNVCCGGKRLPGLHEDIRRDPPKDEDWVVLATADATPDMVNGQYSDLITWVIPRQDLADLRFDRVYVHHDGGS